VPRAAPAYASTVQWLRLPSISKEVTCPACGDVVASAEYRRWPGWLELTSPRGERIAPTRGGVEVRLATQALADAGPADRARTEERLRYARAHVEELFCDLRCGRGHVTVVTVPHLVARLRRTPGRWVPAA
jgi:hypothetical protein